ncbi:MAG: glycerate kinase [Gammaproteobacteria bacterium]
MASAERQDLLDIYGAGIGAVDGRRRVAQFLHDEVSGTWKQCPLHVVGIGKAAVRMAAGAVDVFGSNIVSALLITKTGHCEPLFDACPGVRCFESAHPVPDSRSFQAGRLLVSYLEAAPASARFIFLISGGASSLVERAPVGWAASDVVRIHRWLLGAGLPIGVMNRVRKRVSRLKAGRLARLLRGRATLNLLISDVPDDDPRVIGSGLLVQHRQAAIDVGDVRLPRWMTPLLANPPTLAPASAFEHIRTEVIAWPGLARAAAAALARQRGYRTAVHDAVLQGDALAVGRRIALQVANDAPGVQIWSSETTVTLPPEPGRGGRCQSLALAAAMTFAGRADRYLLAAGTDGTDGPGTVTGALVDGGTVQRGQQAGLDAAECLVAADAGTFLEASHDLLTTGPTGTNVMDLLVSLKTPADLAERL